MFPLISFTFNGDSRVSSQSSMEKVDFCNLWCDVSRVPAGLQLATRNSIPDGSMSQQVPDKQQFS